MRESAKAPPTGKGASHQSPGEIDGSLYFARRAERSGAVGPFDVVLAFFARAGNHFALVAAKSCSC